MSRLIDAEPTIEEPLMSYDIAAHYKNDELISVDICELKFWDKLTTCLVYVNNKIQREREEIFANTNSNTNYPREECIITEIGEEKDIKVTEGCGHSYTFRYGVVKLSDYEVFKHKFNCLKKSIVR